MLWSICNHCICTVLFWFGVVSGKIRNFGNLMHNKSNVPLFLLSNLVLNCKSEGKRKRDHRCILISLMIKLINSSRVHKSPFTLFLKNA